MSRLLKSQALAWAALIALSVLVVALLELAGLPAALLLGPMAAGIVLAGRAVKPEVPRFAFLGAQGLIGCMIAGSFTASITGVMLANWPLFLGVILAVIASSSTLGWLLARWQVLPGSTAVWGSSPGAATAMTLMAGAYGADMRLVAFMQYLRVLFVAASTSLVARLVAGPSAVPAHSIDWFPAPDWVAFAATLTLAWAGAYAGRLSRLPAGSLLLPLALGAVLHGTGMMRFDLPPWLLAIAYALVGWNIGLGFTRAILAHAARALPRVTAAILVQLMICGALALLLARLAGIDFLTAYLATSPGGVDSVAIIAASSGVDLSFVMALQTVRVVLVMAIAPRLALLIARRTERPPIPPLRG